MNFNIKEEATVIHSLTKLQFSAFKAYVVLPILSLLTVFVLPICMYWSQSLTAKYLYNRVTVLAEATALLVEGKDGNIEIV